MLEIKTCPLCDGFSSMVRKSKTIVQGQQEFTTYVECKICRCRGPRCLFRDFASPTEARQKAVEMWNRRDGSGNISKVLSKEERCNASEV